MITTFNKDLQNLIDLKDLKQIYELCEKNTNNIQYLKEHRDYIENGNNNGVILGYGDRSFQYFWECIIKELPTNFKFLEIGVYKAQILSLVQLISNHLNKRPHITGVTLLIDKEFGNYNRMPYIENIYKQFKLDISQTTIINGDSHKSSIINQVLKNKPYDCIYIDGDHSYIGAKSDIENYLPMLRNNGLLVIDDASCNLNGLPEHVFKGIQDVSDALDDFILENPYKIEYLVSCGHLRLFYKL